LSPSRESRTIQTIILLANHDLSSAGGKKSANRLSSDGKWRSFPHVPHLLQYVSSGDIFARRKNNGKIIRHSLKTAVGTTVSAAADLGVGVKRGFAEKLGRRLFS
jgi:hypothetical protein